MLRDYVLVSQDRARIEHYRRTPDEWAFAERGPGQRVELAIGATLDIDTLYAGIPFDP